MVRCEWFFFLRTTKSQEIYVSLKRLTDDEAGELAHKIMNESENGIVIDFITPSQFQSTSMFIQYAINAFGVKDWTFKYI